MYKFAGTVHPPAIIDHRAWNAQRTPALPSAYDTDVGRAVDKQNANRVKKKINLNPRAGAGAGDAAIVPSVSWDERAAR